MTASMTIAQHNDAFRKEPTRHKGQMFITAGIQGKGDAFLRKVMHAVTSFDDFTTDNDPHGEHDFGSVEVDGKKVFFKFDYYDNTLKWGSPDPSDPEVTTRVLTIMFSHEY